MKSILSIAALITLTLSCFAQNSTNQDLINELEELVKIDQLAASNAYPPEEYKSLTNQEWNMKKDSIYRSHQKRLEEMLNVHGFLGYDLVGKRGSQLYWLMVQHADFNPAFQKRVLDLMRVEIENNNASSRNYAFLTDRINLNTGEKQIYGTQIKYNSVSGKVKLKSTVDVMNLNKRRSEMNLEPIEDYLKEMQDLHDEMNK